jgi:hypothetical protein
VTLEGADAKLFRGPGALGLELRRRGSVFEAQRGSAAPVVVAASSFSSLDLGAMALPLSGERVAVWGGLGSHLVILGPDLRRLDEPGIVQRTLRPLTRFRASAKSTFDRICYAILLVSSVGWLLALPILRRRDMHFKRARLAAALFVALLVVGATGFYNVIVWI